ncbi:MULTISPECIES: DoxX family protein [Streptomyces]|uniref:DoxX protein n=1 Tax=Streptomyces amritsarensis TaxID=681158 RepID=A0ABX3FZI8_9ACTN|nr:MULTISPECIES: DoxX family protein [Streptomyces]MDX6764572.1 DoxX family protein [Streptomyces sp. F8]OLZ63447.1 DoxX protein [Streptomyces amritsarensis]
MDTGLLILRLLAGLLIAGHGVQKVSFRLGGSGLAGGIEEFRHDGFRGGALTALAAGAGQIGSGLLLAAGALTPLAAAGAIGVMTVALTVKWPNGLWVQKDGYEYPLVLITLAAALALTGPGRFSADRALGLLPWPAWSAVAAVAAGSAAALATRALLHRPAAESPTGGIRPR